VLKTHPTIVNALVGGPLDERWGLAVVAAVDLGAGAELDQVELKTDICTGPAGCNAAYQACILLRTPMARRAYVGVRDFVLRRRSAT
jgi:non-homologous end joining protein Ku